MLSTPLQTPMPVWQMFLPLDYIHIISNSSSPPSLLSLPKKDLYFTLCYHPILTHNGDMKFQLEKESGKKWYMVGARALSIQWVDTPRHWTWISLPDSRVAKLKNVGRLEIKGKVKLNTLSSNTNYEAYFVFKLVRDRYGFRHTPVELDVSIEGTAAGEVRSVILDPPRNMPQQAKERVVGGWRLKWGSSSMVLKMIGLWNLVYEKTMMINQNEASLSKELSLDLNIKIIGSLHCFVI
ncbi:hypothetical protein E1A91_D10G163200v1 [Gossypium mustelinum]|uniref:Uncharacterized protein n=1 Tax=Gossypium mustelinum TaxID=34275 RepID=A0A5D2T7U1_GOSMU|nr:hypothetical protein E1A91_D10G163200v1 [Gossypium mustelinum]